MAGWDHEMTSGHMICSSQDLATHEHAQVGGTELRLPRRQVVRCYLELGGKKCMPDMARETSYMNGTEFEAFLDI